jgi:ankyrin repeat protein
VARTSKLLFWVQVFVNSIISPTLVRCESRHVLSGRYSYEVSRLSVIIRIQEDCTPEVAAALDVLHKEVKKHNLERNGKRLLREGEASQDEIEAAIIQALAPLQNTQDFEELISKTNDYKQTLAHFAVHFGYTNLLRQLVGWNIDLTIADVNGFTALHCAYKKGDRASVGLLLEKGASETVLNALGRAPPHLMPEGFASLSCHDTDMFLDDQPELEQMFDPPSLLQSTDSGLGASDSDGEKSKNKSGLADILQQSQSSGAPGNSQSPPGTRAVDGG